MRIAQIAPLYESVPPKLYGGTERIVSYLTEELVRAGHEVTLFASGDSVTDAELVACSPASLRLDPRVVDPMPIHVNMIEKVMRRAQEFDLIHFHVDFLHFPVVRGMAEKTLTTLHGRLDLPDYHEVFSTFSRLPLVSVSDDQRRPMPPVNWAATVHHGLPADLLPFKAQANGGYLAFIGRISPEKGPDRAIEIASRAGLPLKIAAKVDRADREYWESTIKPMIEANPHVEYVGEIDEIRKASFLGDALALLFPINWPEPFGLVMIEAMSCGTPVVAFRCGSTAEVIENGRSGMLVKGVEEAVEAVKRLDQIDRATVRSCFQRRFTAGRMAAQYGEVYRRLLARSEQTSFAERSRSPRVSASVLSSRTIRGIEARRPSAIEE
jgi:glycosyltransferase involved in cell wall biosynthesis